jgi:hypothetical protein
MPISALKRRLRRLARRAQSWSTIVGLTLAGNEIQRESRLKNTNRPVMLIYGFGATRRTLAILEQRLRKDGYPIFSINLGGFFGTFNTRSIEELARYIETKVERLYKKFRFRGRLTVIGHSKGGLIGHYYVKKLKGAKRVKTLVTLGTPHNGTPWALIGSLTPLRFALASLKQMSPYSDFVAALKKLPFPKNVKIFSIYSRDDTVCPFPFAVLDEAKNVKNVEVFGVTHSELLIKKNVYYALRHAIKDEMPESWEEASRESYREHMAKKGKSRLMGD